ncbi:hypothetical protein CDG79_28630 [Nostoc sp. 'Peltigera membranacea cyanobiont' 232]|nr:hypothetical protein CDG79_28630 [Nostoc sp. 'Peltigera membranacea cyanobiont' 232]
MLPIFCTSQNRIAPTGGSVKLNSNLGKRKYDWGMFSEAGFLLLMKVKKSSPEQMSLLWNNPFGEVKSQKSKVKSQKRSISVM